MGWKDDSSHDCGNSDPVNDSTHTQQRRDPHALEYADTLKISEVVSLAKHVKSEQDIRLDSPSQSLHDDAACNISNTVMCHTDTSNIECTLPDVVPPTNDSVDVCITTISDTMRHDDVTPRDMCVTAHSCKESDVTGIPISKALTDRKTQPRNISVHSQCTHNAPSDDGTRQPMICPPVSMATSHQPKLQSDVNPTQNQPGRSLTDVNTTHQHPNVSDIPPHKTRQCPVHAVHKANIQDPPARDDTTPQEVPAQSQNVNPAESALMAQFKVNCTKLCIM